MHRLIPVVFNDDWGSHVSIASVTGRRIPTEQPESELWMGAHEAGPAGLVDGPMPPLLDLVAADPSGTLGELATSSVVGCPSCSRSRAGQGDLHSGASDSGSRRSSNGSSPGMRSMSMTGPSPSCSLALAPSRSSSGCGSSRNRWRSSTGSPWQTLAGLAADARNAGDPVHAPSQPSCRPRPARWPISPAGSSRKLRARLGNRRRVRRSHRGYRRHRRGPPR